MAAVNGIEPEVFNCFGSNVNRFSESWETYNARLASACMATPAFNARLDELRRRTAADDFARTCRSAESVCSVASNASFGKRVGVTICNL